MAGAAAVLDEAALAVMRNLPQALLVALVVLVVALVAKDIMNGMLRRPFLDPNTWQPLTLVDVKQISHNTKRFRFALPHQEQVLGLPLGQHISIKGTAKDGSVVMR
jgi:cytochrome-b5 reductase